MEDERIGSRKGGNVRIRSNILVLLFSSSVVIKNQLGKALSTKTNYYLRWEERGEGEKHRKMHLETDSGCATDIFGGHFSSMNSHVHKINWLPLTRIVLNYASVYVYILIRKMLDFVYMYIHVYVFMFRHA